MWFDPFDFHRCSSAESIPFIIAHLLNQSLLMPLASNSEQDERDSILDIDMGDETADVGGDDNEDE